MLQSPFQIITFLVLVLAEVWAFVLLVNLFVHIQLLGLLDRYSFPPPQNSRLFYICQGYAVAVNVRPLPPQKRLRIAAMAFYSICNLFRMMIYYIEAVTQKPVYDGEQKHYYILSVLYNVAFWLAYSSYILAVSDRFQRIEMIVPNTIRYKVYKASQWIIGIMLGLILLLRTICQVRLIVPPFQHCPAGVNAMTDIYLMTTAFVFVVIELVFNIRLILSSLRAMMTAPLTPTINQAVSLDITPFPSPEPLNANEDRIIPSPSSEETLAGRQYFETQIGDLNPIHRRQQRKLFHITNIRYEMMFYFGLLVVLDMSIIGMQILAGLVRGTTAVFDSGIPANELEAWCSVLIIFHLYFGFKLLDLFLVKLQEAKRKRFDTIVDGQTPRQKYYNNNYNLSLSNIQSTVTGEEVVTAGLLPSFTVGRKSWATSAIHPTNRNTKLG